MYDIIIIGGGAAGLTAALYSLRAGKRVLVLESETFGGQITASPRVENYPGIPAVSGSGFADALLTQVLDSGGEIELETVSDIQPDGKYKKVLAGGNAYACKSVILATGVRHRKLGVDREEELAGNGISYCAVCDGAFFGGKDVAVVGGGDAALQAALFLSGLCQTVFLIHRRDAFRAEAALIAHLQKADNIQCLTPYRVHSLIGEGELTGLTLLKAQSGDQRRLAVEGLFVCAGQIPHNDPFASLVQLDASGYILAGEDCRTTADGVFAAGDCRQKQIRQLTTAASDGAVAALAACGYADALD